MLSAAECRRMGGNRLATSRFSDPDNYCVPSRPIPPDPYSKARLEAMVSRGEQLHRVTDLARLLHGKRVAFVGDSLTGQVTNALQCALRRAGEPVQPADFTLHVPKLRPHCEGLWDAVTRGRAAGTNCSCRTSELTSWLESHCRVLGRTLATARQSTASSFVVHGMRAVQHNFTFFERFGDVYKYIRACPTCVPVAAGSSGAVADSSAVSDVQTGVAAQRRLDAQRRHRTSVPRVPPRLPERCRVEDYCATHPLPSHVAMARSGDLADVIVLNFGLWYHDKQEYLRAASVAMADLNSFAQIPGKVGPAASNKCK